MNKNFISAEEFLKQSEKVQEELINYVKNKNDILSSFDYTGISPRYKKVFPLLAKDIAFDCIGEDLVPLLQMHQLIAFIHFKTDEELIMNTWEYNNKIIANVILGESVLKSYDGLLDALWQVTIQIIEEGLL